VFVSLTKSNRGGSRGKGLRIRKEKQKIGRVQLRDQFGWEKKKKKNLWRLSAKEGHEEKRRKKVINPAKEGDFEGGDWLPAT